MVAEQAFASLDLRGRGRRKFTLEEMPEALSLLDQVTTGWHDRRSCDTSAAQALARQGAHVAPGRMDS